jgi:hypothetical protein
MQTYRMYFLDDDGRVSGPPVVLQSANDEEAIKQARDHIDGKSIELWRGGTLVDLLPKR